jgi:hypothetical protein
LTRTHTLHDTTCHSQEFFKLPFLLQTLHSGQKCRKCPGMCTSSPAHNDATLAALPRPAACAATREDGSTRRAEACPQALTMLFDGPFPLKARHYSWQCPSLH